MTPKERNLLKGAIRRVFSRSDLRREVIDATRIDHFDPERPRVKKWSTCPSCNKPTPTSQMECDHIEPIIPLSTSLEHMSWDEVVKRTWCDKSNLMGICKTCHKAKSLAENKQRRANKKLTKVA